MNSHYRKLGTYGREVREKKKSTTDPVHKNKYTGFP